MRTKKESRQKSDEEKNNFKKEEIRDIIDKKDRLIYHGAVFLFCTYLSPIKFSGESQINIVNIISFSVNSFFQNKLKLVKLGLVSII